MSRRTHLTHLPTRTVDSPIFIVGANRSGTTLLRLILNAHPRIAIPDELIYFDSSLAGVPIEQWRRPNLSAEEYEAFVDHFLTQSRQPLGELDLDACKDAILAGRHDFRRPYQHVLEAWAQQYDKERWGEKTPGNLFYADVILDMFPDAQFLYMVRDPRAGVASMQGVSFFPDNTVFNALSRRKHDMVGRDVLVENVPPSQRLTIRYEDLVRHPSASTQAICRFLGETFVPEMLHFHEDADQYMKDEAEDDYNAAATQPITDDRIDAWKQRLSNNQVAIVESVCSGVMRRFGYEPTDRALSLQHWAELHAKQMYWAFQCWRHREIRHYTVKHAMFARTRDRLRRLGRHLQRRVVSISPFHTT